jgi:hypothetical protein
MANGTIGASPWTDNATLTGQPPKAQYIKELRDAIDRLANYTGAIDNCGNCTFCQQQCSECGCQVAGAQVVECFFTNANGSIQWWFQCTVWDGIVGYGGNARAHTRYQCTDTIADVNAGGGMVFQTAQCS